jgi:glyceraldehyde 3-phosphate dehydrogenase
MTIKVAINGYGRIGRMVVRAIYEEKRDDIKVVAINGLGGIDINAHLTQYDSAHGKFPGTVVVDGDHLVINGDRIKMFSTRNPLETNWGDTVWMWCWSVLAPSHLKKKPWCTSSKVLRR